MKEIDESLTVGQVDMAVDAMKDVPGDVPLPEGLVFAAYLERDDVRGCVAAHGVHQGRRPIRLRPRVGRLRQAFELGAYVASVLNRKGARDIIAGIPH